jgi:hypothetical protein
MEGENIATPVGNKPNAATLTIGQYFLARDNHTGRVDLYKIEGVTEDKIIPQVLTSDFQGKIAGAVGMATGLDANFNLFILLPFPIHKAHIEVAELNLRGFAGDTVDDAIQRLHDAFLGR